MSPDEGFAVVLAYLLFTKWDLHGLTVLFYMIERHMGSFSNPCNLIRKMIASMLISSGQYEAALKFVFPAWTVCKQKYGAASRTAVDLLIPLTCCIKTSKFLDAAFLEVVNDAVFKNEPRTVLYLHDLMQKVLPSGEMDRFVRESLPQICEASQTRHGVHPVTSSLLTLTCMLLLSRGDVAFFMQKRGQCDPSCMGPSHAHLVALFKMCMIVADASAAS